MRILRRAAAFSALVALAFSPVSHATNGYFLIGYGSKSEAMGGAGVALGHDGLAAAYNPASMILQEKTRLDFAGDLFIPKRSAYHESATLPADETSSHDVYLIPALGGIYKLNKQTRMGMAVVGAGAGSRYSQRSNKGPNNNYFFNFGDTAGNDTLGVDLIQVHMLPSLAYRLDSTHTLGAAVDVGMQTFRARGLGSFGDDGFKYTAEGSKHLTDNGWDWSVGMGLRFGWLGQFLDKKLNLGANYSTKTYMTEFKQYQDLFAEGGQFDAPAHWTVGLAYKFMQKYTVAFDVMRIEYDEVNSVGNPGPNAYDDVDIFASAGCPLGGSRPQTDCFTGEDHGLGFGWNDQTVFKLGLAYDHNKQWTYRIGYNYGGAPIQDDQILFNLLAPATVEKHLTLGLSYRPKKGHEVSASYQYAFENTISGPTPFPPVGVAPGESDNGAASMYQHVFGVTYGLEL